MFLTLTVLISSIIKKKKRRKITKEMTEVGASDCLIRPCDYVVVVVDNNDL